MHRLAPVPRCAISDFDVGSRSQWTAELTFIVTNGSHRSARDHSIFIPLCIELVVNCCVDVAARFTA
jgi:hypothetical protein